MLAAHRVLSCGHSLHLVPKILTRPMEQTSVIAEQAAPSPRREPDQPLPGMVWCDTNANLTYRRNDANDGWDLIGTSSVVTSTEYGYLDGVTSAIQTQINTKIGASDNVTLGDAIQTLKTWLLVSV